MKRLVLAGLAGLGLILIAAGGYETVNTLESAQYLDIIRAVKEKYGWTWVPDALTLATIETESSFDPNAVRQEPAINDASYGLMQILLSTARGLGYRGDGNGLFDPETNITYGTKYHVQLYNMFNDWDAVIHAYNEGPGNYRNGKRVPVYWGRVAARMAKWQGILSV